MIRPGFHRRLVFAAFVLALASTTLPTAQEEGVTHPLAARGKQPNRGTFSAAPWESIDMASGNAMLTFPGLTLPGVNGMDFQFAAIANLGGTGLTWSFGMPGPAMVVTDLPGVPNPVVVAMDGGQQYTFGVLGGGYRTLTCDEVTLTPDATAATLRRTNGVTYSFQKYGSSALLVTRSETRMATAWSISATRTAGRPGSSSTWAARPARSPTPGQPTC